MLQIPIVAWIAVSLYLRYILARKLRLLLLFDRVRTHEAVLLERIAVGFLKEMPAKKRYFGTVEWVIRVNASVLLRKRLRKAWVMLK